jgi:hypothetical protein
MRRGGRRQLPDHLVGEGQQPLPNRQSLAIIKLEGPPPLSVDHAKGPARGRPFVGKRRAEARSATASSAPFGFARAPTSANQEPFFFFFFDAMMMILQVWTG